MVTANFTTVQSALTEASNNLTSTYLGVDPINGELPHSWPICSVTFLVVVLNTTSADCSPIQGLLSFVAWSQITPAVISKITELSFVPLPFGYKTYVLFSSGPDSKLTFAPSEKRSMFWELSHVTTCVPSFRRC